MGLDGLGRMLLPGDGGWGHFPFGSLTALKIASSGWVHAFMTYKLYHTLWNSHGTGIAL